MDKNTVLKVISKFRHSLETQGIRVDRMILFGSYAQGCQREGSDIDLVVVSKDFEGKDFWQRIDMVTEAIYDVFQPIEAIALTPDEWEQGTSPVTVYAREGETVYAA